MEDALLKNLRSFAIVSVTGCDILNLFQQIQFYQPIGLILKMLHKEKCKNKDALLRYKNIEKPAYCISVCNQNSEKKWNSKIPEPKFLLSCEQNRPKNLLCRLEVKKP
jgi:hypothetical protein